jgi:cardiolipin synthase
MTKRKKTFWLVLAAFVAGIAATLMVFNLGSGEKKLDRPLERLYATGDAQFRRSMGVLLGPPLLGGNAVETLVNGDRIFASMLQAIRGARRTITFETYIYWSESIGREFADALAERARAGAKIEQGAIDEMRNAGVEVERFHKPHWSHLPRLNNRTHRKVLVVDGTVGFTGGVGIADKWRGDAQDADHWRDTHFRVEGPAVAQMQAVFDDNWSKATSHVLHGEAYFPALGPRGDQTAQMFSSSPTGGSESMHLMYLMAITAAQQTIDLSSSYFVPDDLTIGALVAAMKRGVKVRIVTPGTEMDAAIVRRASRARWGDLLEAGALIAEYRPTMFHCKVLVVDSLFVSVGSTNFDNRSFRLNDEANLNVLDAGFARRQIEVFEADLRRADRVTLDAWRGRPWREKLVEHAASLLGAQL